MTVTTYIVDSDADDTTASVAQPGGESSGSRPPASLEGLRFLPSRWLPADQEYFWSAEWQAGEQETLRELGAGGGVEFDNTEDLIRWLFSADDD
jgi:hypothetical protein